MAQELRVVGLEALSLEEAVDCFKFRCEAEGLSPHTLRFYIRILRDLMAQLGADTQVAHVSSAQLRRYIAWLGSDRCRYHRSEMGGLSPETVHAHFRAVKALFRYLHEEGFIESNPMTNIKDYVPTIV